MTGYDNSQEMVGLSMSKLHLSQKRWFCGVVRVIWKIVNINNDKNLSNSVLCVINNISKRKKLEEKVEERIQEIEQKNIELKKVFKLLLYFGLIFSINIYAEMSDYEIKPNNLNIDTYMNIKILDTKEINFKDKNKIKFTEISDLAYKRGKLFAVGDKGVLYEIGIDIHNDKIEKLKLISATKLKNKHGKKLKKKYRDSEGIVFVDDKLAISFEGKERIDLYDLNGLKIKKLSIHQDLQKKKNYQGRNKGLEAVAYSDKYGIITAPERPLKDKESRKVYSEDKIWKFEAEGSITGLQFISKNRLLILLRDFNNLTRQRVITLIELNLKNCKKSQCKTKMIAKMDSQKGWNLDNFEGLTKLSKNRFLIVSDDNDSFLQKTLLVLFEIID